MSSLPPVLNTNSRMKSVSKTRLQYYCGNCNNVLKEMNFEIDMSNCIESCPFCGTAIYDTIQRKFLDLPARQPSTVFTKASSLPKLTFDILKLDEMLHFLTLNNYVCISGIHTQTLIERLCVRAQLSKKYGGLDSKVLLIDGANSSDLYMCVDFARQYGLDVNKILNGIISSRAFTTYQLVNTIIEELPSAIKKYNVKIIIITNMLNYFTNDSSCDTNEIKLIIPEIINTIHNIQNCLVVVSLGLPTQYDSLLLKLFSRTIHIQSRCDALSVHVDDNGQKKSILLKQNELDVIPQH